MEQSANRLRAARALMDRLQWKRRPLLLFEPPRSSDTPETWKALKHALSEREVEVRDRDMAVIEIRGDAGSFDGDSLPPGTGEGLRKLFGVEPEAHEALLVGKDGGVKLRKLKGTELEEIFELIDSMPMRRAEMKGPH